MEQKISSTADGLTADDVISPHRDWYVDSAVFENIKMTDVEELALMLFLYFWGGEEELEFCECPDCNLRRTKASLTDPTS